MTLTAADLPSVRAWLADSARVDADTTVLVDRGYDVATARDVVLEVLAADVIAASRQPALFTEGATTCP